MKPGEFNHKVLPMRDRLKGYAARLSGNDDDAEDIVQEVMLRLWNMRQRLGDWDSVVSLAFTIAHNLWVDKCRSVKTATQPGAELDNLPVVDASVEERDEVRVIRQIVDALPPLQRQLFKMKEIDGYESEEIMQITGCSADNLRRNLSRARLKIRDTYMKMMKGK